MPRFTIVIPNAAYLKITGTTTADLVGNGIFEAFPDNPDNPLADGVKKLRTSLEKVIETKQPHKMATQRYDIPIRGSDIFDEKYYSPENVPVLDDGGNVVTIIHTVTDITEKMLLRKKQHQLELQASIINDELDTLKKTSETGSWEMDLETGKLTWSDEFFRICGYEPGTIVPTVEKQIEMIHPHDREKAVAAFTQAAENGETYRMEKKIIRADGTILDVFLTVACIKNHTGKVTKLTGLVQNVTGGRQIEQMLRDTITALSARNEFIETILQNLPVGITVNKVSDGKATLVNKPFTEIYGWDEQDMADIPSFLEKVYPDKQYRDEISAKVLADIRSGDPNRMQWNGLVITTKTGEKRIVNAKNILLADQDILISTRVDVTEREQALQQLKESNQRYDYLTKATSDAVWDWDIKNGTIFWGEGFETIFGYDLSMIKRDITSWSNQIHPKDKDRVVDGIYAFIGGNGTKWEDQYRYFKADRTLAYVIDKGIVIRDDNGKAIRMVGGMRDITIRKEEELRVKLLQSVVTNANDGVLITEAEPFDEPGPRTIYVNDAFTKITGYTAEEVIGKSPRFLQGPKTDQNELRRLSTALRHWESCEITVINYKKNGEEFWLNFSVSPVADETGWYTHWVSIEKDVTAQKNEELQKLLLADISQLFNAGLSLNETLHMVLEKLAAFGAFALAETWLVSRDQQTIEMLANIVPDSSMEAFYTKTKSVNRCLPNEGMPGTAWASQNIEIWHTADEQPNFIRCKEAKEAGLQTVFSVPVIHNNQVIGAFIFGVRKYEPQNGYLQSFLDNLKVFAGGEIKRKQLEQELYQLFNFAPDIICISAMNGYFIKVNPAMSKILGYSEEELLTTPYVEFLHPDDRNVSLYQLESLAKGNPIFNFENRYITKQGKTVWLSWTATSLVEEKLNFGIAKDITEKKDLENLVKKANSLARIGGWELDLVKNTLYWSDITKEIHETEPDFDPNQERGTNFYKEGANRDLVVLKFTEAIREGKPWDEELQIITAKGNEKWVRVIGEAEFVQGKCVRVYGSFQDIDERKKNQFEVIKALQEKNTILESIGDAFFALDKNWVVTYWNKKAEQEMLIPKNEIVGRTLWDVFPHPAYIAPYQKYHSDLDTGVPVHFEDYYENLGKWYEVSVYPADNGLSVYFKDITERKTSEIKEKEAAAQQSLFVSIVNSSDDAIISKTLDGMITSWNHGAERLFGFAEKEAVGSHISLIIPESLKHEEQEIISRISVGQYVKHYETERLKKDGTLVNVSLTVSPVIDSNGNITGASKIARDITEKKKAEDAIRLSNERYNLVAKATNESIWDWDLMSGNISRSGEGMSKMLGLNDDNINLGDFSKRIHPEDAQRVHESQLSAFANKNNFYWEDKYRFLISNIRYVYLYAKGYIIRDENGKAIRMIGSTQDVTQQTEQVIEIRRIQRNLYSLINNTKDMIWSVDTDLKIITANKAYSDTIELYTHEPTTEGDDAIPEKLGKELGKRWTELYERALKGETFTNENLMVHPVTGEQWYNIISYSPIINREGQITGVACFSKNITELKKAHARVEEMNRTLQIKAEQLAVSNAELEQFAYVASHDLQEPLRMVTSFLTQLEKKYGEIIDDKGKQYINFAVDGAKRMRQIILDLLEFSRVGKGNEQMEDINITELVNETTFLFKKQMEEKQAVIRTGGLPVIQNYKSPIRQVFQNLISNSLKYATRAKQPQILVTCKELEQYWEFCVADNGIGINTEYFDKIFIIFQRLHNKDEYSGTGMGLAITKKIIENLGGKIWVESAEGSGSSFYFIIPKYN
jgi:PAS domain S-box-containing protein